MTNVLLVVAALVVLCVGAFIGWIASLIMGQRHRGFWSNAGLGILGSVVGTVFLSLLGIGNARFGIFGPAMMLMFFSAPGTSGELVEATIEAVMGAVVVLVIMNGLRGWRANR